MIEGLMYNYIQIDRFINEAKVQSRPENPFFCILLFVASLFLHLEAPRDLRLLRHSDLYRKKFVHLFFFSFCSLLFCLLFVAMSEQQEEDRHGLGVGEQQQRKSSSTVFPPLKCSSLLLPFSFLWSGWTVDPFLPPAARADRSIDWPGAVSPPALPWRD